MVKKLFKYEMKHYIGIILLIEAIVLLLAFSTRVVQIFESSNVFYDIIYSSSWFLFISAIIVGFIVSEILIIVRFYRNLYSAEGYLSFTLPVTESQHLFVKLVGAVLVNCALTLGAILALSVATAGELGIELIKAGIFLIGDLFENFSSKTSAILNCSFYVFEFIIYGISQLCFMYLLYFSCMTLGQLAKKNRVLAAIGIYFAYTFIMQAFGTVITMFFAFSGAFGLYSAIIEFIEENFIVVIHIGLCMGAVINSGLSLGLFALNCHIMSNKLNLE